MQATRIIKTNEYTSETTLLTEIQNMLGKVVGDITVTELISLQVVSFEVPPTSKPYIGMQLESKYKAYVIVKGDICQINNEQTPKS